MNLLLKKTGKAKTRIELAIKTFKMKNMEKMKKSGIVAICVALALSALGFTLTSGEKPTRVITVAEEQMSAKPELTKLKAEIQTLESSWAAADNARNANAIAAFYADDAMSLSNNKPMLVGKGAIQKDIAESLAKRTKGSTVAYDVMDVFGNENTVTEVGKTTVKDTAGKVTSTGKYIAIWEKRNGKFICVRDIYNDDAKEK
jgi:uncharacterized protein (TIGR02246 family)